jgi:hypothetical protein
VPQTLQCHWAAALPEYVSANQVEIEERLPNAHRYEMDSGKGEYLVKDVSDAARMLPASLFGRVFADSDIVTPLSQLKIPLAHLPPANLTGMTARARRPTVPWYSVHDYNNIQVWKAAKLPQDRAR